MRHWLTCTGGVLAAVLASPATAEVAASSDGGFVSHNETVVAAAPADVWTAMLKPAEWWNGAHTYSGDARNLALAAVPGGCFCEAIPGRASGTAAGAIEHMRVVYVSPNSTLRLNGGLGPLQSEAVAAVLTMTLQPAGEGTKITWDYVVGGYMRTPVAHLAPVVDRVVGEQLTRLAGHVSGR